jgi:hypothetical protein
MVVIMDQSSSDDCVPFVAVSVPILDDPRLEPF